MQIKVEDDRIYQNILIFIQLIALLKEDALKEATYTAFVNRKNGQIFFSLQLPDAEALNQRDWKKIALHCMHDPQENRVSFELQEEGSFTCEDLTPLAYRVMSQTLNALNQIAQQFKTNDMISSLEEFSQINLPSSPFKGNIIDATWHEANRYEAEEILRAHPYGSYLFRRDEFASILSEQLQEQLGKEITCFTCTFSEALQKVSDVTLVYDGMCWFIYNDDPNLSGKAYESVQATLEALSDRCKLPVFH